MIDVEVLASQRLPHFIQHHHIDVGDGHTLHVAEYGRRGATPLVYLHGGPGAGCQQNELALFEGCDLQLFFIDQRGAGRSKARNLLKQNTMNTLIEDLERVRLAMQVDKWCVVGGSSGATLGWLYSGIYPEAVISQVYWGMFVPSHLGVSWLFSPEGAAQHYPQQYDAFCHALGLSPFVFNALELSPYDIGTIDLMSIFDAFESKMASGDAETIEACQAWINWELTLSMPQAQVTEMEPQHISLAKISHHFAKHCYFNAAMLLAMIHLKITAPTILLQGEKDHVCPSHILEDYLAQAEFDNLKYHKVKGAYHSLEDKQLAAKVIMAIKSIAKPPQAQ